MIEVSALNPDLSPADLEQIRQLYLSNGWIETADDDAETLIRKIVKGTFCFAVAREEGKVIGMGRAISDGVSDAYIQDVTVFPEYRKQGIGASIVGFLVDYLHAHGINWIGLISVPGQESFYQGIGFSIMQDYTPFFYTAGRDPEDK